MLSLDKTLHAWATPDFETILKQELAEHVNDLPLQQGLSTGNYVADAPITVVINRVAEMEQTICISVGIFYQGVIGGCSCTDDPTPVSDITEYCEVQLEIDKASAATAVALVTD